MPAPESYYTFLRPITDYNGSKNDKSSKPMKMKSDTAEPDKSRLSFPEPNLETVLITVTGMSPAVLTETVWALAHEPEPVIPDRVIVLTTCRGRETLTRSLFEPLTRFGGLSPWDALRTSLEERGHQLDGRLRFGATPDDIRVITALDRGSGHSKELSDIRSLTDNQAAADFLLEQVRGIVENPDTRLVASIAGGRKTMGALLYACLTLVGRETDLLTHVLVNEPFETLREFFFPGQPGGGIRNLKSGTERPGREADLDPADAKVELAVVPFVPLRNLFVRELGRKAGSFAKLVDSCRENIRQRAGEEIQLEIESVRPELVVNGSRVRLAPLEHVLLLFLARRAKQGEPAYGAYTEAVDDLNQFRNELIEQIPEKNFGDWRHADSLRQAWDEQDIRKAASGIRSKLRNAGGNAPLLAACLPEKGRCSLSVPGELIHLKLN